MSKNQKSKLRALTIGAMMAALSIILERIITIMPASNMMDIRISLSNVPIILAGIFVSPIVGGLCGVVSDIIGCFLSGYPPYPPLTAAPLVMGVLPAVLLILMKKNSTKYTFVKVSISLTITHLLASFLITTLGLCSMRGVPFIPMLITRLPTCFINTAIDITLVYLILKTPINKHLGSKS